MRRDGDGQDGVDGRLPGHQVGQCLPAGGLDVRAHAVLDVTVRQGVDRRPRGRRVLGGEGPLPPVHPRLGHPPPQPTLRPGPRGPLQQQLRADPRQRPTAPPPQVRTVLDLEVPLQHRHHRLAHLRWGSRQLLGDHTRAVGVQPALAHRRVQPTQTAVGVGPLGTIRRQQHRRLHPPLGVQRGHRQHPGQDRRRVQRHVPQRPVRLNLGAVLQPLRLDRRQAHDRRVLHRCRHIHRPLRGTGSGRPLRPRASHPRRLHYCPQGRNSDVRGCDDVARTDPRVHHRCSPPRLLSPSSYPRFYGCDVNRTSVRADQYHSAASEQL